MRKKQPGSNLFGSEHFQLLGPSTRHRVSPMWSSRWVLEGTPHWKFHRLAAQSYHQQFVIKSSLFVLEAWQCWWWSWWWLWRLWFSFSSIPFLNLSQKLLDLSSTIHASYVCFSLSLHDMRIYVLCIQQYTWTAVRFAASLGHPTRGKPITLVLPSSGPRVGLRPTVWMAGCGNKRWNLLGTERSWRWFKKVMNQLRF